MRIYNSDGSEPEMCGNGIRCLAKFIADVDKATPRKYKIHTLAGDRLALLLPLALSAPSSRMFHAYSPSLLQWALLQYTAFGSSHPRTAKRFAGATCSYTL